MKSYTSSLIFVLLMDGDIREIHSIRDQSKLREIWKTCVHWCTMFSNINIASPKNLISKLPVHCYWDNYFNARVKLEYSQPGGNEKMRESRFGTRLAAQEWTNIYSVFIFMYFLCMVYCLLEHLCYWLFLHLFSEVESLGKRVWGSASDNKVVILRRAGIFVVNVSVYFYNDEK